MKKPSAAACRAFARRTLKDIIHGEELDVREIEGEVHAAGRRAFRSRVALGIVALSILSALAGWRASVFDEASSSSGALYHQEMLLQQQRQSVVEGQVTADLGQFDQFEQHWLMHEALQRQSAGPGASGLAAQARQEEVFAEESLERFNVNTITWLAGGNPTYDASTAFRLAAHGDTAQGLSPGVAGRESLSKGTKAVKLTLVAALFVAGLVLLTLAQTMLGRRVVPVRSRRRSESAQGGRRWLPRGRVPPRDDAWSTAHTLVVAGTLVGLLASVIFLTTLVS